MPVIEDSEFGSITVRRSARASHIRIRVAPDGGLRVSAPRYAPLYLIKRTIAGSRQELHAMLEAQRPKLTYESGSTIGKSHSLVVKPGASLKVKREGLQIVVSLPADMELGDPEVQAELREQVIAALRREAKGYLPRRLKFLAEKNGFSYTKVRFSHSSSRWGSCSSTGTISLNIALMKLPFELIDYVIIHELAHTEQMNHSNAFWALVATHDPAYKQHRGALKQESPNI